MTTQTADSATASREPALDSSVASGWIDEAQVSTGSRLEIGTNGYRTGAPAKEMGLDRKEHREHRSARRQQKQPNIDASLLGRTSELLDGVESSDPFDVAINLAAASGTVMELWESAAMASEVHRDVLSILESGVRQAALIGSVTPDQARFFREALTDLSQGHLVPDHADVLRDQFIRAGFGPLGFVDSSDESTAGLKPSK